MTVLAEAGTARQTSLAVQAFQNDHQALDGVYRSGIVLDAVLGL